MATDKSVHQDPSNCNTPAPVLATRFDDSTVHAVLWRGRWTWRGAEVGTAIGYDEGRILVDKIRGDWREDFREGKDFALLRGEDLRAFREASSESLESSGTSRFTSQMLVLFEPGIDRALILSRTEKGRRLRDLLVDHVLPQLRATGSATLPGAPSAPGLAADEVRELVAASLNAVLPQIVAELRAADRPELAVLDRDAEIYILAPIRAMARTLAGINASEREVSRQRSAIHARVRRVVGWQGMWRLYPRHRLGELLVARQAEQVLSDRVAEALAHSRQLSLKAV